MPSLPLVHHHSQTRGGHRAKKFVWYIHNKTIFITNENNLKHQYAFDDVITAVTNLFNLFKNTKFPLANNVELLAKSKEKEGLETALYRIRQNTFLLRG